MNKLRDKKVLVVGGAGFIGSHLVDELVKRNYVVTVLDHLKRNHERNLDESRDSIRLIKGSVTNKQLVKDNMDVDVIFHEASCNQLVQSPIASLIVNVKGTLNILENMTKKCVLVFSSTGSVYGNLVYAPQDEKHPCNPTSPYGISKLAAEQYINFYAKAYELKTVILRCYNVVGVRQNHGMVVPTFIKRVLKGEAPIIEGDGSQKRCFTSINDVVTANMLAYEKEEAYGLTFNIASGQVTTIKQLAELVCSYGPEPVTPGYRPSRLGDIHDFVPSIDLARKVLGYHPQESLEDVLPKIVEWMKCELRL